MSLGFFWVIYAQLSLVPDDVYAIFSFSVTCKVDALWAARKTRHRNLILFSGWFLQAFPLLSSLCPCCLTPGTAGKAGKQFGHVCEYLSNNGGRRVQPARCSHATEPISAPSAHTLCPLLVRACRTLWYPWAATEEDVHGAFCSNLAWPSMYLTWSLYLHLGLKPGVYYVRELFVAPILQGV